MPPAYVLKRTATLPMLEWVLHLLANAILEGNDYHQKGMLLRREQQEIHHKRLDNLFTIPKALEIIPGVHEIDWKLVPGVKENLATYIRMAIESDLLENFQQIFLVLILIERAVLITYDRDENVITLIDGHAHRKAFTLAGQSFSPLLIVNRTLCLDGSL